MEVTLHIYDVTNSGSDKTNNTIMQINKIFKDGIGLGGIFHSAVQVHGDEEWSFGYCEEGTGVFHCPATKNPMYTYRESIKLGQTAYSKSKIKILREMSREWPGESYDLLAKNCNHFCDEFCGRLGVDNPPGWVNRFANAGDAAIEIAGNTAYRELPISHHYRNCFNMILVMAALCFCQVPTQLETQFPSKSLLYLTSFDWSLSQFRQAKTEIVTASKVAYRFLAGITSSGLPDSTVNSNCGAPRFQPTWFKNLVSPGAKPSTSSELDIQDQDVINQLPRQDAELPSRLNPEGPERHT